MLKTDVLNVFRQVFKIPFLEKTLAKYTQNISKDHFLSKLPLNYTQYNHPSYRNVERNGIFYHLDISDYMEWLVYFGIQFEPRQPLYELIKKDDQIFDVGANIGEVSMNMAKRTNRNVYAFEPDPIIASKLMHNASLNSFKNLVIKQVGFGDSTGSFLMSPEVLSNRGGNRIIQTEEVTHAERVSIVRMDDFVAEHYIDQVDLIKIDVEGFELNVLNGSVQTIKKFKPKLFIEVNDRNLRQQGASAEELLKFIREYYDVLRFVENDTITDFSPVLTDCHFDLIALPDEN